MSDDGAGGDRVANDGVWSATRPPEAFFPGEMLRWRLVATDNSGSGQPQEPAFHDRLELTARLRDGHGLIRGFALLLPVFYWFTTNPAGLGTTVGARGLVSYDGVFYDNVLFRIHGESSTGFPKKKLQHWIQRSATVSVESRRAAGQKMKPAE